MTPCLLVGNLSADVSEVALRDAFQAHRAINALIVAAPAAAAVTHGFVWLDACAVLVFLPADLFFVCLFWRSVSAGKARFEVQRCGVVRLTY